MPISSPESDAGPRLTPNGRRGFLTRLLATGAAGASSSVAAAADAPTEAAPARRIDTHHHFFSPTYVKALDAHGLAVPIVKNWSIEKTLADMDKAGVATAVLSVTTPQVGFVADVAEAQRLARESNEYAAELGRSHPGRFGSFAMLPMQSSDAALAELAYALDVLKADGIGLLTSYGNKWLGHLDFAPVLDELNQRKAVLYTHPTVAPCCIDLLPNVPPTVVEFGTDTTRTIVDIVFSGTAARCPDMNFIFSHAGGTLPFLTERLQKMPLLDKTLAARVPNGVLHELQRFHYDTAWSANRYALPSLLELVGTPHLLFGSDYPYRTGADNIAGLIDSGKFSSAELEAIGRGNALRLLPGLHSQ
ncbi:MAG: amidohydrolase family protein [Burkholderiaceae bacterium]